MLQRLHLIARGLACILAGVPTTALIPLPVTMRLFKRFSRERRLRRLHCMIPWARFCRRWILRVRLLVEGKQHLPACDRGYLYVSNHQSYIDILVLMDALDTVAFLSKKLVRYIPVLGSCAYAGGSVYLDRGDRDSRARALREVVRMCSESVGVVVFPEGTRSATGHLRPQISTGLIKAAHSAGLKIIPVALDGTHTVFPKEMDRVGLDQRVRVRIGAPVDPADHPALDDWLAATWGEVVRMHDALRADPPAS